MVSVTMKELLEAGVHFGHQTKRWNPKMKEYIYGQRNGIYIIDLQKTIRAFKDALQFVKGLSESGKAVLFVGTKKQAQDIVKDAAAKCESSYVNQRWLGGLLTNFKVIRGSIDKLVEMEEMREDGRWDLLSKKEQSKLEKVYRKLSKNLGGIKALEGAPGALFVTRLAYESGKPLVIVLNKWDLVREDAVPLARVKDIVFRRLGFISYAPLLTVSALTGKRVTQILDLAEKVYQNGLKRIGTSSLNKFLMDVHKTSPPLSKAGKRFKIKYMTQMGVLPPTFVLFTGSRTAFAPAHEKHFMQVMREKFGLWGTPIKLILRSS